MILPLNSHSSQGFFLCSASVQLLFSATFRYVSLLWPRWGLSDAHSASSSRPSIHYPLESSAHLPYDLVFPSSVSFLVVCVYLSYLPSFGRFPTHHVPSVRRNLESANICGTSSWHSTARPCSHSWGWLIIQPLVLSSLTNFSPWDSKEVYHPHQGKFGVIWYNEPSHIVFTFFL